MKKNYRIVEDLYYSSVEKTDEEVDDYHVFSTLNKAKRTILQNMRREIMNYKQANQTS